MVYGVFQYDGLAFFNSVFRVEIYLPPGRTEMSEGQGRPSGGGFVFAGGNTCFFVILDRTIFLRIQHSRARHLWTGGSKAQLSGLPPGGRRSSFVDWPPGVRRSSIVDCLPGARKLSFVDWSPRARRLRKKKKFKKCGFVHAMRTSHRGGAHLW